MAWAPLALHGLQESVRYAILSQTLPGPVDCLRSRDPHMVRAVTPVAHAGEEVVSARLLYHERSFLPLHDLVRKYLALVPFQPGWRDEAVHQQLPHMLIAFVAAVEKAALFRDHEKRMTVNRRLINQTFTR